MSKILFVSGVSIDRTPVVKYTIAQLKKENIDCETIELKSNRLLFILHSIIKILSNKSSNVIFIGLQTLPLLFIFQLFTFKLFYWYLESYSGGENNSFVIKLLKLEKLIKWQKITAIFPIKERAIPYKKREFKNILIFPNASILGQKFKPRKIQKNGIIKISFYGALDKNTVYLNEFIDFVKKYTDIQLDFYGNNFNTDITQYDNINYKGPLSHNDLLAALDDYHYSVIGYKPINFNTEYCAPNKLYEALSLSLPIIVNKKNPSLINFPEIESVGIIEDFENLNHEFYIKLIDNKDYSMQNANAFQLYNSKFNLNNFFSSFKNQVV